jgi:hypothetical protein
VSAYLTGHAHWFGPRGALRLPKKDHRELISPARSVQPPVTPPIIEVRTSRVVGEHWGMEASYSKKVRLC